MKPHIALLLAMMVVDAGVLSAQSYPTRPIRILTGSAGGGNDAAARLIVQGISGPLGQPVIVENRGSVSLAAPIVAQSPPDGYTLILAGDLLWLGPLLRDNALSAIRDFSPISMLASTPNVLVVHPSMPVRSVKELIALAKLRPGELNYSSGPSGSIDHIMGELFKTTAGVNMTWIPSKGSVPALYAIVGGETQVMFGGVFLTSASIKSGKLRAVAVTSAQPSALASGLPTMAASGVTGFELVAIDAMYAPANTPAAIVNHLNRELVRFLATPEAREKYLLIGAEVVGSSPEEHLAKMKSRMATIGKLIKDAGIKTN